MNSSVDHDALNILLVNVHHIHFSLFSAVSLLSFILRRHFDTYPFFPYLII
jgi:hypothetical protein